MKAVQAAAVAVAAAAGGETRTFERRRVCRELSRRDERDFNTLIC